MKSLRSIFILLLGMCLGILFAVSGLPAQNATSPAAGGQGAQAPQPKYRSHFVVYDVQKKTSKTIFTIEGEFHAPNWTPDGKYIISDMGGELYRIAVNGDKAGNPEKIAVGVKMWATNDHALSWDGKQIAVTGIILPMPKTIRSAADIRNPLFIMNTDGSATREVHLGWLHGWAPDGRYVVYTQYNKDNFDIYRINVDGSGELQLTSNKGADDGPEYSADGKWIYFCSNRSGKYDGWRIPADGAGPADKLAEKITNGDTQDWFPHISPDGKWLYTISYPMDHPDHVYIGAGMKIKLLAQLNGVAAKGAELRTVETFFGGQGSGNTGGWAPDSKRFAWTEYEKVPDAPAK
jgi:Tol biopolymer transport system component